MTPVAYLRRSSAVTANGAGRISYAVQESAVLELARRHGDSEPELIVEWGKSGAAKSGAFGGTGRGGRRKAYNVLRSRIVAGEISAIYAYSLSRLARSTRELLDLAEAAAVAGTTIRLAKEGTLDFASPSGRLYLTVLAAVSTFEAELASERAHDRVAHARENGLYLGEAPTGYVIGTDGKLAPAADRSVVGAALDAFGRHGNYRHAALDLNERGIASPRGKGWTGQTIKSIVDRERGKPTTPSRKGSRTFQSEPLARLLYCAACGNVLTPTRKAYTTRKGSAGYYRGWRCFQSSYGRQHPRPTNMTEARLLPSLQAEADRLRMPTDRLEAERTNEHESAALDARRARLIDAIEAGAITRIEAEPRLAAIGAERARLDHSTALLPIAQAIDWTWPPDVLGHALAALWDRVAVDLATGEIEAEWTVPEWRA